MKHYGKVWEHLLPFLPFAINEFLPQIKKKEKIFSETKIVNIFFEAKIVLALLCLSELP
jgi:hypothetical protein